MADIYINGQGDGAWIMAQAGGAFTVGHDVSIMRRRREADGSTGPRRGGFALTQYLGRSICVHMAGTDPRWCSRDLLWMTFDYVFVQLGCARAFATVHSGNTVALNQDLRGGWRPEATLRGAYPDGDMLILAMERETCPWLKLKPRAYKSNQ